VNTVGIGQKYLGADLPVIVSQSDVHRYDAGQDASGGYEFKDVVDHRMPLSLKSRSAGESGLVRPRWIDVSCHGLAQFAVSRS